MSVKSITFEAGYIVVKDDQSDIPRQWAIKDVLRAADIPQLTHTQVKAITSLANLVAVLIRTLISRQVLDESFMEDGDYDLEAITEAIEQMGGDYGEPDISVET